MSLWYYKKVLINNYELYKLSHSKSCLVDYVIISLGVISIVRHCSAINPPVTNWSIFYSFWHVKIDLSTIIKDKLKPQIFPAIITYCILWTEFNRAGSNRWMNHYFPINQILKLIFFQLSKHEFKHIFRWMSFFW